MTYLTLARKWRPQDFSALIGQGPIVTALQNALREGRIAQAYLFSGIRGVGKTTTARLLAKALNCESGPTPDPCNHCRACREITVGSDLDVIEVDAATYSKVEQVRELTESLKYGPARDRYKVVIIDEIHRLSRQAFDALLKIVEEPPPHLSFVFATTEIESVPATILSRCQEFHFRRVPAEAMVQHLTQLCAAEEIEASETALRLIARAGEGSVRDGVALLDQLATFGSGSIADEDAFRLLGGLDTALFHRLLSAILDGASPSVSEVVREVEDQGRDPRQVYAQFLAYCRDALHCSMGADPSQIDLPADEAEALAQIARKAGYENLLRLLNQLLSSEQIVRRSEAATLAMEIAWLRAAELPKLVRVEEILAGGKGNPRPGAGTVAPAPPATALSLPFQGTVGASDMGRAAPSPPVEAGSQVAPPGDDGDGAAGADDDGAHREFLEEVSRRRQSLAAQLEAAQALRFDGGKLEVVVALGDHLLTEALARGTNREIVDRAVAKVWGAEASWSTVEGSREAAAQPHRDQPQEEEALAQIADHPTVQTVLDIFGGKIETVERHSRPEE